MYYLRFPVTILAGMCFLFQSNFTFAQKKTEVLKTETSWFYPIENNLPAANGYVLSEIEYNKKGKKIKETSYKKDGSVNHEHFLDYSTKARETYWELSDGTKVKSETEVYNDAGQLLERIRYSTDGKLQDKINITYKNGEKSKEVYFNKLNEVAYTVNRFYNKEQKTVSELYINDEGKEEIKGAIRLDSNGLRLSYDEYEFSGPFIRNIVYERDEAGRLLVKTTYATDKTVDTKEVFEYTANGKQHSTYRKGGTKLSEHIVYKYTYYKNK